MIRFARHALFLSLLSLPCAQAADPAPAANAATPASEAPANAAPANSEPAATETSRKQSPTTKQWVNWLPPTLPPHEVQWLRDDSVFSLYFPQQLAEARGAVLLVPAAGQHAAWPDHIRALSEQLPAHGWSVLVVTPAVDAPQPAPSATTAPAATEETPAAPDDNTETDEIARAAGSPTVTRGLTPNTGEPAGNDKPAPTNEPASLLALRAGLDALEDKQQKNIVLIGMGASGITALELAHASIGENAAIRGLILADLPAGTQPEQKVADILRLHRFAVLDITHPAGRAALRKRAAQLKQFPTYYTVLLPEPLATIQQVNDRMARRIRGWLNRYVPGQQKTPPPNAGKPN